MAKKYSRKGGKKSGTRRNRRYRGGAYNTDYDIESGYGSSLSNSSYKNGSNSYGSNSYGSNSYGTNNGLNSYGTNNGLNSYGSNSYGTNNYGTNSMGYNNNMGMNQYPALMKNPALLQCLNNALTQGQITQGQITQGQITQGTSMMYPQQQNNSSGILGGLFGSSNQNQYPQNPQTNSWF